MKLISEAVTRVTQRADGTWERLAFGEVLVPDVPNVFGEVWSREAIREAAYSFAVSGYGLDVEHSNEDASADFTPVEWFIAQDGQDVFTPGAWVVGVLVHSDELWDDILNNKINGFSYEAFITTHDAILSEQPAVRVGVTEPDVVDGHSHTFLVRVDESGRPVDGNTDEVNGHTHQIQTHTVTGEAAGHTHRFTLTTHNTV